jgi:putative PIN family toxin of toxin-antitoxin system
MTVVLDTNILISACLKPDGLESALVRMVREGRLTLVATPEVLAEYREVLLREKFRKVRPRAEEILAAIESCALPCVSVTPATAASDEDDNRFLECAVAGKAEYLITGNLRHYPPSYESTAVVNARMLFDSGAL